MNSRWIRLGLSLIGSVGVGVTSWLSVKGHEKAKGKTEKKDKLIAYTPAIISGAVSVSCILGSHHLSNREIAALTASCGYLAANRKRIMAKLREELGDEKAKEVVKEAAIETSSEQNKKNDVFVENTGHGPIHFIEDMFGREFYCSLDHVVWAEKMINHMFMQGERVNYNTFYELLGLKKTRAGWENGWPCNEDIYGYSVDEPIHFENLPITIDNGDRGYLITVRETPPVTGYLEMED